MDKKNLLISANSKDSKTSNFVKKKSLGIKSLTIRDSVIPVQNTTIVQMQNDLQELKNVLY